MMSVSVRLNREISVTTKRIAPFHPPEQRSQLAVTFARLAAHDLRNPHIHFPIPVLRKTPDLILLVGRMLPLRTNP